MHAPLPPLTSRASRSARRTVALCAFAATTLLAVACAQPAQHPALAPDKFVEAYREAGEEAVLLDCRTPEEYAGGSLPGARNYNFRAADFEARLDSLDRDRPVFVFCQSGGRSGKAAAVLEGLGFSQVYDLRGGYSALPPD